MLLAAGMAGAADRYWVGGAGANWSVTTSWSTTSGGSTGASLPDAGDTAIFDGNGVNNATVDASYTGTVDAVDIRSGYTGTITQKRNLTVDGAFSLASGAKWNYTDGTAATLDVGGSMTIDGTLECQWTSTTAGTEGVGRTFTVGGALTVGTTGIVTADNMGFSAGQGPGTPGSADNNHRGGAHGGKGGHSSDAAYPTKTYGNYLAPVSLGSGGARDNRSGGAIRFTVTGAVTNNGSITANGINESYAGGSGGSVFLTSGTLAGSGQIRANGGTASGTAGGGGGRVSLVVTNTLADFSGFTQTNVSAYGGNGATWVGFYRAGGPGTVYLETQSQGAGNGTLIIDNNNWDAWNALGATIPEEQTWTVPLLVVTNCGILEAGTNSVLRLASSGVSGHPAVAGEGVRIEYGQLILTEGELIVTNWDFRPNSSLTVTGNVVIASGAVMTHHLDDAIDLVLDGNLTVNAGGKIDADALSSQNQGGGSHTGAHGGEGWLSAPQGTPYGSVTAPVTLGSKGYLSRYGGGRACLRVSGVLTNNGTISANGAIENSYSGSGGSVYLTATSLAGTGNIQATGGDASLPNCYNRGGGGRVAVVLTGSDSFAGQTITARGGKDSNAAYYGGAGTVYLKSASQVYGTLIVDNSGLNSDARARITASVTDTAVGDVIVRNNALLLIDSNQTLTVYGNWTNVTNFASDAYGTVAFAGTNTATLNGNWAFGHLTCTNGGKTLRFEAGKTNTVARNLTLAGTASNLLTLASTSPGTKFNFRALPGGTQVSMEYLDVTDSNANDGDPIIAIDSTDGDNNDNWIFADLGPIVWDGSVSTDWNTGDNWDLGRIPLQGDPSITIPAAPVNQPVLDKTYSAPGYDGNLIVQSGATLNLAGFSLRIGGGVTVAGTLTATGSETLTFEGVVDFTGGTFNLAQSTLKLAGTGAQGLTTGGNTFHILDFATTQPVTIADTLTTRDLTFLSTSADVTFQGGFTATNVDLVVSGGAALTFGAGQTYAVGNRFRLIGAAGNLIVMDGSGEWNLNVAVPTVVKYVDAKNSNALGDHTIYAIDSTNSNGNSNWNFGDWKVWSGGTSTAFTLDGNWLGGTAPGPSDFVLLDSNGDNAPRVTTPVTIGRLAVGISQATTLTIDTNFTVAADVTVHANGTLTHSANGTTAQGETYKLALNVGGDLMVDEGGRFDVADKGYAVANGPGAPSTANNNHRGAAYGGEGGDADTNYPTACYGSITTPMHIGSGGTHGIGAGSIRLGVTETLINNGVISANSSTDQYGRGSAGSLYATAGAMAGAGVFSANGGTATGYSGGGGGGRVGLVVTNAGADFSHIDLAKVMARGGTGGSVPHGGAGTVYLQTPAQGAGKGSVTIDNNALIGTRTQFPPFTNAVPDELRYASVIVTNRGALAVTTSDRIASLTVTSANELLNLGTNGTVLTVNAFTVNGTVYTKGGLYTTNNWNGYTPVPANVSGDGAILLKAGGTVFLFR